jgi:putative holliday junction resolvase
VRVLGVDFGSKRIGLAVGDTETGVASPKPAIDSVQGLAGNIRNLRAKAEAEEAEAMVIGVPYGIGGEETPMAKVCLRLIQRLQEEGATVFEVDESLTSLEAESNLRQSGGTAALRKSRLDSEAACQILERFFAQHGQAED